jgi:hypothetical protein
VAQGWTVEALLTPPARYLALFVMVVSFIFPLGGLPVDLCVLHATTGLPCPGCGMTRAISAISQGELSVALGLNPFAFFAWPTFFALAVMALMPATVRARVEAPLRRSKGAAKLYELIFFAFLGFGMIRLALFMLLAERFP